MPLPAVSSIYAAISAIFGMQAGAATIIIADLATRPGVMDNERLIAWCILGAIGGALVSLVVFTPHSSDTQTNIARRYFAKLAASFLTGVCVAPGVIDYLKLEVSTTNALTISFFVSLFGVTALHIATPFLEKAWRERMQKQTGVMVEETIISAAHPSEKKTL